ncbi:MAG: hypothetical protein ACI9XK_003688, partial [Granulosicoccus sp.]
GVLGLLLEQAARKTAPVSTSIRLNMEEFFSIENYTLLIGRGLRQIVILTVIRARRIEPHSHGTDHQRWIIAHPSAV